MTDVGVIGAGRMGQPIIGHLARKGFRTHVYDIDAGKRAAVEARGAQWAADLAALAAASDVMLVCVGYDEELRALFPQLASAARPGAIVADMARECGLQLPQAEVTREICRALKPRRYDLDKYGR